MVKSTGKVKWFNAERGYGFIIEDQTNNEIFCHIKNCTDDIKENDRVEFILSNNSRGPQATNVKLLYPVNGR